MERHSGVPEVWELVSAEIDGNGLSIDLRRKDGRTLTLSFLVTSEEAVGIFRAMARVVEKEIARLGKLGLVLAPIEPHDPDEEYREPD